MSRMSRRDFLGGRFRPSGDPVPPGAEEGGLAPRAPGDGVPPAPPFGAEVSGGPEGAGGPGNAGMPGGVGLPPEFTPALLRAEARRLGLDPGRLDPGELAAAVLRAMYARAPHGAGRAG